MEAAVCICPAVLWFVWEQSQSCVCAYEKLFGKQLASWKFSGNEQAVL